MTFLTSYSSLPFFLFKQIEEDKVDEYEVWHGLANLYSSLSHWKDAEICLEKARQMKQYSAEALHTEGKKSNLFLLHGLISKPFAKWAMQKIFPRV